ncbi:VOC family protein [Actinoplanes sp. TRM 88003]|uniref:VOC family protein n=1 Tax=Paractinoplanes aksuensis TaxID=2939490 RepID=A0ABT1DHW5_9ACTN|nr:VOC family protein [Actinoplanes aksuensis]MCO8270429.1 VOC family protein [Actinoplanes aksuensis]
MELFVEDLDVSVSFYREVLGFQVSRRAERYVSLRRGIVVLGLGPTAKITRADGRPGLLQATAQRRQGRRR